MKKLLLCLLFVLINVFANVKDENKAEINVGVSSLSENKYFDPVGECHDLECNETELQNPYKSFSTAKEISGNVYSNLQKGWKMYYKLILPEENQILNGVNDIIIQSKSNIDTKVLITSCQSLSECILGSNDDSGEDRNFKVELKEDIKIEYIYIIVDGYMDNQAGNYEIDISISKNVESIQYQDFLESKYSSLGVYTENTIDLEYIFKFNMFEKNNYEISNSMTNEYTNFCEKELDEKCSSALEFLRNMDSGEELVVKEIYTNNIMYIYTKLVEYNLLYRAMEHEFTQEQINEEVVSLLSAVSLEIIGSVLLKPVSSLFDFSKNIYDSANSGNTNEKMKNMRNKVYIIGYLNGVLGGYTESGEVSLEEPIPKLQSFVNENTKNNYSLKFNETIKKTSMSINYENQIEGEYYRIFLGYFERSLSGEIEKINNEDLKEISMESFYKYSLI